MPGLIYERYFWPALHKLGSIVTDQEFLDEWTRILHTRKCEGVDMETGMRDCWTFPCLSNHTWRWKELWGNQKSNESKKEM